ncbi:MAG: DUF86 domain-containing protein [Clostridiales bacterium]|nr:DUF86 domain-containing protein [Clostridiales bacterium]MCF8023616.1 DUF86 domain-containing protein [Clostridiales bacterium]
MLNPELIIDRLDQIRTSTNRMSQLASLKKETFLADPDNFAIAEHHLRRALEALLDIGRHILAKKGFGRPEDYMSIISSLGQHKVLPPQFADQIQGMAGYRNRLVHGYARVTQEEIYDIVNYPHLAPNGA